MNTKAHFWTRVLHELIRAHRQLTEKFGTQIAAKKDNGNDQDQSQKM
jgi:hypothetical protein